MTQLLGESCLGASLLSAKLPALAAAAAVALLLGACQVSGSQAQQPSPSPAEEGGAAAGAPAASDSVQLVNQTEAALVALAFHPMVGRPLKSEIEVNLDENRAREEPSYVVDAWGSTALWGCGDALEDYQDFELHLYRVGAADSNGTATARLSKSITLTAERLAELQQQNCRLEVDALWEAALGSVWKVILPCRPGPRAGAAQQMLPGQTSVGLAAIQIPAT